MKSKNIIKYTEHIIGESYKLTDLRLIVVNRTDIVQPNFKIGISPTEQIICSYDEDNSFSRLFLVGTPQNKLKSQKIEK